MTYEFAENEPRIYTFQGVDEDGESTQYRLVAEGNESAFLRAKFHGLSNLVLLDVAPIPLESTRDCVIDGILENPFLGKDWLPVLQALEKIGGKPVTRKLDFGRMYVLTERHGFDNSPYLQWMEEHDGSIHFEIAGNLSLQPKLTEKDVEGLRFLGWEVPDADLSNRELLDADCPNPYRSFPVGVGPLEMFAKVFEALTSIYGVTISDGFFFERIIDADEFAACNKLFRYFPVEGSNASIFYTLPGMLEVRKRQLDLALTDHGIDNSEWRVSQIVAMFESIREGAEVLAPLEDLIVRAKNPEIFVAIVENITHGTYPKIEEA